MTVAVFTDRSSGIGIALFAAVAFSLIDASWSLAIAKVLAACALVPIVPVARRLG